MTDLQQDAFFLNAMQTGLTAEQARKATEMRVAADARHFEQYGITLAEGEAMERYMSD
jgi:LDH2 family malate/lactate/ureidoglycolate dehydrogenase